MMGGRVEKNRENYGVLADLMAWVVDFLTFQFIWLSSCLSACFFDFFLGGFACCSL